MINEEKTKRTKKRSLVNDPMLDVHSKRPRILADLFVILDKFISSAQMSSFLSFLKKISSSPFISSLFSCSEKLASSRWLKWIVISLLPVMILLKLPVERYDYDVWWQMALGKYYLTHHTLMVDHSIFSWTPADSNWIYNTCLGSIIVYLFYALAGGFGLWIFQWLIFLGIFLLIYFFFRVIHQKLDVTSITLIAALGIACVYSVSYYKPELFSILLGCLLGVISLYVKITRRKYLFYLYPFIFAVWVNLHGGFILGFCFLACFFFGELLNIIIFPQESFTFTRKEFLHLGIACLLALTATGFNPYGMDYVMSIYHSAISESFDLNSKYIRAYIPLWTYFLSYFKNIGNIDTSFSRMGIIFWIMVVMLLFQCCLFFYELIKNRTLDFTGLIVNIATFWGSMRATRANFMFPLMFFFTFFYQLHHLNLKSITRKTTVFALLIFILFFFNIAYVTSRYSADNKWFGSGLESFAPVKEVAFLKKYHLEGPVFNDYLIGGYLLWDLYPDYKVFIDPRHVPFAGQVAPDYWEFISKPATAEDIIKFNKKYPFKTAIIHYKELPLIFDFLNAGWRLVYFEKNAAVLVHQSVLSKIPPETQLVDLGPMRFKDIKNPEVLLSLFSLYVNLNPPASQIIYDFYRKNVSDFYKRKNDHLRVMEDDMKQKRLLHQLKAGTNY